MNVLIVDDRPINLKLIRAVLEGEGHAVCEAQDGLEALAVLGRTPVDAIISDILMPRMDGYRLCYEIRRSERLRDIPVIIYTATYTSPGDEKLALHAGADKYLRKPAPPGELAEALREVTRGGAARAQYQTRPMEDVGLLKEYSEQLVAKLEEKNIEMIVQTTALDSAANGIMITDVGGVILMVNLAFTSMTGFASGEAVGKTPRILKSGKHDQAFYQAFWKTIRSGQAWYGEFTNRRKDGTVYVDEHTVTPVRATGGDVTHFITIMRDVTARKQAELALRETQERLQRAVSAGNVGLWDWDLRTGEVYFSPVWKRQIGYADGEIGNHYDEWQSRLHPEDRDRILSAVGEFTGSARRQYNEEFRLRHKDGSYRWILAQGSLEREAGGRAIRMLGTHVDITGRKRLEDQFLQAQKMESVGRLAGGIAHDFNNLLSVILGYSELALTSLDEGNPARAEIILLRRAGERAADLTRQLLAFSRQQILQPVVLNLNDVVADMESMLQRVIGEDVEIVTTLAEGLGNVNADPGQIEQVLMNLMVNARDAMPAGGRVTIETGIEELDASYTDTHADIEPGRYVRLAVSDTGTGMDKDVLQRLFDPFFTTKERGKGTGLGLATVYGIVKQSKGSIHVYSELGKGTTFKVYLPLVENAVQADIPQAAASPMDGTETVLLVEDEEPVRTLVERILAASGYTVLPAATAGEALALIDGYDGRIHLMLTDVVLPGMSGPKLAEQLAVIRPDMKVMLMSGYTDDAIVRHGMIARDVNFLGKPFTAAGLMRKVRGALDMPKTQG
ncbi:MAG: response regulator [Candidatus Hydrogenedentes bacterium]|nr:response regulator [Candidatus Hydrogenedentota bacterium]